MKKCGGDTKEGFTIIEVVLVLAVAGLIFLMVFMALPALQRAERDSARREDMEIFLGKVKDYQTANRGALPIGTGKVNIVGTSDVGAASWESFFRDYLGTDFTDPRSEDPYTLNIVECGGTSVTFENPCVNIPDPQEYEIVVVRQATCSYNTTQGETVPVKSANPRKIAILYELELGQTYCANS